MEGAVSTWSLADDPTILELFSPQVPLAPPHQFERGAVCTSWKNGQPSCMHGPCFKLELSCSVAPIVFSFSFGVCSLRMVFPKKGSLFSQGH